MGLRFVSAVSSGSAPSGTSDLNVAATTEGDGYVTLGFPSDATPGAAVEVRLYFRQSGDPVPTSQEAWDGTGADATASISTTVGGEDATVTISTNIRGEYLVEAVASYDGGATLSEVVTTDYVVDLHIGPPVFVSAAVENRAANKVTVNFSDTLAGSTTASDWTVLVNGSGATESAVQVIDSSVFITLGSAVTPNSDTVTVAYTGTGLTGPGGDQVATFTAQSTTNTGPVNNLDISGRLMIPRPLTCFADRANETCPVGLT